MSTLYRFSVAEFDRMVQGGIFDGRDQSRLELIYGHLRETTPPNPPHEHVVDTLMYWSIDVTKRERIRVRVQNSLGIPELDSVVEPDIAWLRQRDDYRTRRPQADDVLLLIEVAETSLVRDRIEKGRLYAEAGITDYWIVNLIDGCLEVYRDPRDGYYRGVETFRRGEHVSRRAMPEMSLAVDQALGY